MGTKNIHLITYLKFKINLCKNIKLKLDLVRGTCAFVTISREKKKNLILSIIIILYFLIFFMND